jgi:hypothetical protein
MYNITESDYSFVESNNVEFYGVRLLSGKWRNVVYIYGKVSIKESPELDQATISFTYSVQEEGNFEEDDLINDPEFKNYIGAILQHIMEANLGKGTIGKSNTNTHTKSSD